ncbi:MAG TPA: HAD family phosphatase [bacterium]|jgi:FMN phosphatase YigB (HAD superfamily)|nr:HAD family phosphatase [bacterium]
MTPPKPEVLLLDLGNVTVRLRLGDFYANLARACRPPLDPAQVGQFFSDPALLHHGYERGQVSGEAVYGAARSRFGLELDYRGWLALWNDFFEPNRPMEALVARLAPQLRIWGLSNTNAEHLAFLRLHYRVLDRFEGITASNEAGAAKPEPAIYRAALRSLGVEPGRVLYLDDVPQYLEGGRALGLQVFHYTFNDSELRARLAALGLDPPPLGGGSVLAC